MMPEFFRPAALAVCLTLTLGACTDDDKKESPEPQPAPTTIENIGIRIAEVTKSTVNVEYTPSTDLLTYYPTIIDKAYFDEVGSDEKNIADDLAFLAELAKSQQKELSALLEELLMKGKDTKPFKELKPKTDYVAYAFGLNTDGKVTSKLFKQEFTTPAPGPSENTIEMSVGKIGIDGAVIECIASNKDPYILDVWETSKFEGLTDQEIMQMVLEAYYPEELAGIIITGSETLDVTGRLASDTPYTALAFGYEAGDITTALVREEFRTRPGDWVDCSFTIAPDYLNSRTASFTVTASDETVPYFFTRIPTAAYDPIKESEEQLGTYLIDRIREEAESWDIAFEQYLKLLLFRGEKTESYNMLNPGDAFRIIAAGVNLQGKVITPFAVSDAYTVPQPSAATVTFGEPTQSGDEVSIVATPSSDAVTWKGAAMSKVSANQTDEELYAHMMSEFVNAKTGEATLTFTDWSGTETEAHFIALGIDADGNPGVLVRKVVTIQK